MDLQTDWISDELKKIGQLKFELLAAGLRITQTAHDYLRDAKRPIRTRSGASGGLDVELPHDVYVNVPVDEKFAYNSNLILDCVADKLVIRRGEEIVTSVKVQPIPQYYSQNTSDGVPMVQIGQMCSGDRFCYGMTGPYCWFWTPERRCGFCAIGYSKGLDASQKTVQQLLETLEVAVNDPFIPAKHVLIGGGTPNIQDMGALLAAELCKAIKSRFNLSCYVMISAPSQNTYIDILRDSGADELGMNIEFYSENACEKFIPGKNKYIGPKRYLRTAKRSAWRFQMNSTAKTS